MRLSKFPTLGIAASLLVVVGARDAATDPKAPAKQKPVTQADIDRLEKKIADQQRMLEKLVRLQKEYLTSLIALGADQGQVAAVEPDPKPDPKPPIVVEPKQDVKPKVDVKPAALAVVAKPVVKKTANGKGTIVGKIMGGEGDVYVYLDDIATPGGGTASIRQEGKEFVPRVLAVQKGTRVDFPNRDAIFHNVFSVTPDSTFDLGSYKQGDSRSVTLTKPGVVNVYCNMHPNMAAYILVTPSAFVVHAGKDGFYRMPNVPSGKHKLVAWAPNSQPVLSDVEVTDDAVVTIELEVKKGHARPHTNKDGAAYGSYKD
jgi:plastocyanin